MASAPLVWAAWLWGLIAAVLLIGLAQAEEQVHAVVEAASEKPQPRWITVAVGLVVVLLWPVFAGVSLVRVLVGAWVARERAARAWRTMPCAKVPLEVASCAAPAGKYAPPTACVGDAGQDALTPVFGYAEDPQFHAYLRAEGARRGLDLLRAFDEMRGGHCRRAPTPPLAPPHGRVYHGLL